MYDGVLRLPMPASLVGFADDDAKKLDSVEARVNAVIQAVESWPAVAEGIQSQRAIKYLGVFIDTRLSFKEHLEYVHKKVSGTAGALSRMLERAEAGNEEAANFGRDLEDLVHSAGV
ncbi:hypothetical protein KR054_007383, partial [Drosophila jambulina]